MSAIVMTDRIRALRAVVFAALCVALAATAHVAMAGAGVSPPVLAGAFGLTLGFGWLLAGKRRGLGPISVWMVAAQSALHLTFAQAGALTADRGGGGPLATTDWTGLLLCNPDRAPVGLSPADLARMAGIDPDVPPGAGVRALTGAHHLAATGSGPSSAVPGHAMTGTGGGPGLSGDATASGLPGASGMSGHDMATHSMSAGMITAHVLAALACALLLWRGEAALARLFELLGALGTVLTGVLLLPLLALFARPRGFRPPVPPRPAAHRARLPRLVLLSHALVRRGPPSFAPAR
ncbi:hypothetical protein [Kitasatospora sp. NPDC091207]|uniref:hypothetical protein n=1 Tax=Kitasatospora sp. NPDC091207 TaxID=3364083 RepID=UPI003824B7C1